MLIGFSFGADVLPALYNQLPAADQQQVDSILLLALARSGSFEIEVQGWLGKAGAKAPTGPEDQISTWVPSSITRLTGSLK